VAHRHWEFQAECWHAECKAIREQSHAGDCTRPMYPSCKDTHLEKIMERQCAGIEGSKTNPKLMRQKSSALPSAREAAQLRLESLLRTTSHLSSTSKSSICPIFVVGDHPGSRFCAITTRRASESSAPNLLEESITFMACTSSLVGEAERWLSSQQAMQQLKVPQLQQPMPLHLLEL
jgi:hypothetical protein